MRKPNKMHGEQVSKTSIPLSIYGKLYLAGPIDQCSKGEAFEWRDVAKRYLDGLLRYIYDPTVRVSGDPWADAHRIVTEDKTEIDDSDIIIANVWKKSLGTPMEIHKGFKDNKLVLVATPKEIMSPWVVYHADFVYNDMDVLLEELKFYLSRDYSFNQLKERYTIKKRFMIESHKEIRDRFMV
jgi:hypothetical protein